MSMLDGVSQCWGLSKDCVVWWDAWAAAAAMGGAWIAAFSLFWSMVAIASTVFLGMMTLKLGETANRANATAIEIARQDSIAQAKRTNDERLLILVRLNLEFSKATGPLGVACRELDSAFFRQAFLVDSAFRRAFIEPVLEIDFPSTRQVIDRLHYVGNPVAVRIARILGVTESMRDFVAKRDAGSDKDAQAFYEYFGLVVPLMADEVRIVSDACVDAVHESGIADMEVADRAVRLAGGK